MKKATEVNRFKKSAIKAEVLECIYNALTPEKRGEYYSIRGRLVNESYASEASYRESTGVNEIGEYELQEIAETQYRLEVIDDVLKTLEKML